MVKEELIEHQEEELAENRVTIDDINIITEMHTSQMAIKQQAKYRKRVTQQ